MDMHPAMQDHFENCLKNFKSSVLAGIPEGIFEYTQDPLTGDLIIRYKDFSEKKAPWNDPEVRWVCENHPTKDQEHIVFNWKKLRFERCGGAGMPEPTKENEEKGYLN